MIICIPTFLIVLCVILNIVLGIMLLIKWENWDDCNISFWVVFPWFILFSAIDIACLITYLSSR